MPTPQSTVGDASSKDRITHCLKLALDSHPPIECITHLHGEQTNRSFVVRFDPESLMPPVILKLLACPISVHSPGVELPKVLSPDITPRLLGTATIDGKIIAEVCEYIEHATDGWVFVTDTLCASMSSLSSISALGLITQRMHQELAHALPTTPATPKLRNMHLQSWASRAREAIAQIPELAEYTQHINDIYLAASQCDWPELQRIHGDYHLGQVLAVPARGAATCTNASSSSCTGNTRASTSPPIAWRVIDFEGEPLRPVSERNQPDLAARDIAGMIRSLSYAAGFAVKNGADAERVHTWEHAAQSAFLDSYCASTSHDTAKSALPGELLHALLLDKALYEVTYEATHRPSWIDIPLSAISHIVQTSL